MASCPEKGNDKRREENAYFTLERSQLESLQPFFHVIDRELRIVHSGRSFEKLLPGSEGRQWLEVFEVNRPRALRNPDFDQLSEREQSELIICSRTAGIKFRGQLLYDQSRDELVFMGAPWFSSVEKLQEHNLTLWDFAPTDPLIEFLTMMKATSNSNDELSSLNSALKQRQQELVTEKERAEKLADARIQFLSTMSHEIRTPLNGVLAMADHLSHCSEGLKDPTNLQVLNFSARTLLHLVNNILDFNKFEAGQVLIESVAFNIHELVKNLADIHKMEAGLKELTLDIDIADDVPGTIVSDPTRIFQILNNLISNAIKFTQSGGIKIRLTCACDTELNNQSPRPEEAFLKFRIEDTGIGMSEMATKNIFRAFEQADSSISRRFGGTGLGLAIIKLIIDTMGGKIDVISRLGEGSCFTVILPVTMPDHTVSPESLTPLIGKQKIEANNMNLARLESQKSHSNDDSGIEKAGNPPSAADQDISKNWPRILLVEDNRINQIIATKCLSQMDCIIQKANNGHEAVLEVSYRKYDLILMDLHMPVMDGYEATEKIREIAPGIPIIAVSANAEHEIRSNRLSVIFDGFISKPYVFDQLQKAIGPYVSTGRRQGRV